MSTLTNTGLKHSLNLLPHFETGIFPLAKVVEMDQIELGLFIDSLRNYDMDESAHFLEVFYAHYHQIGRTEPSKFTFLSLLRAYLDYQLVTVEDMLTTAFDFFAMLQDLKSICDPRLSPYYLIFQHGLLTLTCRGINWWTAKSVVSKLLISSESIQIFLTALNEVLLLSFDEILAEYFN